MAEANKINNWSKTDPDKMREYRRNHYHNNKQPYLDRAKANRILSREYFKNLKNSLKCSQCDESHPATLDFHHLSPDKKDFTVSQAVSSGHSIKKIETEISKCIVLCSNCHRKLHYEERCSS